MASVVRRLTRIAPPFRSPTPVWAGVRASHLRGLSAWSACVHSHLPRDRYAPVAPSPYTAVERRSEQAETRRTLAEQCTATEAPPTFVRQIVRAIFAWARLCQLLLRFGPLVATSWVLFLPESSLTAALAVRWWRALRARVERSGPCFIKLAQWASSRPDLFSPTVTALFEDVTDRVRPHPLPATHAALTRAFGPAWSDSLELAAEPLGSGCIAQVYRAELGVGGAERVPVAVKVVHPGVRELISTDLALISLAGRLLSMVPGAALLDPVGIGLEFGRAMTMQLDLEVEARNLEDLAHNFRDHASVLIPMPIRPWVTRDVLVEELVQGAPVLECTRSPARRKLARVGLEAVLKMLFVDNLVHADLHPGNILVVDDDGAGGVARLAFLDAGIVKRIEPAAFRTVIGVLGAMIHYDGRAAGELIIGHARVPRAGEDTGAFCEGIDAIVQHARRPDVNFFDHIGSYIHAILGLAWRHHVQLDPNFVAVALAVRVVEGIAHQLDPEIQVAPLCRPYYYRAVADNIDLRGLSLFGHVASESSRDDPSS